MNVKIVSESKDQLLLNINKTNFEIVNSIRRNCINNVPTLAIEDVSILINNSALYDEVLAHRLGLIPLTTDLKTYVKKEDCKCKGVGCARCTVQLSLEAKGPCTVYSKDLVSTDKSVKPVFDDIPIVKLFEGQEVKLTGTAELGTSTYHSKFAPCFAYHKYYPVISIDSAKASKKAGEIIAVCPRHVFKQNGGKVEVDSDKILDCNLCLACQETFPDIIKVESTDENMLLYIESWGQLKPKEIYNKAIETLMESIGEFAKQVK
ncbi:DNA-directed RNA polymerase subunit D [Candidatus Tiddalikarchaeum anstoanum]|nr:DNA-directed RNA polymerase subunit D [Candidatus Tiddalikarchaeum anstoanum]